MTTLKNLILENYSNYFYELLSDERSLPFGLLVRLKGELIVYQSSCRLSVCVSVCKHFQTFKLNKANASDTEATFLDLNLSIFYKNI